MFLVVLIVIILFFMLEAKCAKTKRERIYFLFFSVCYSILLAFAMKTVSDRGAIVEYHTGQLALMKTNVNNEDYYYAELTEDGFLCFSGTYNCERYKVRHSNCKIKYDSSEYLLPYVAYSEATYSYDPKTSFWTDFGLLATRARIEKNYVLVVPSGTVMTQAEISEKCN